MTSKLPAVTPPVSLADCAFGQVLRSLTRVQPDTVFKDAARYVQWLMRMSYEPRERHFTSVAVTFFPHHIEQLPESLRLSLVSLVGMYEVDGGLYPLHSELRRAQCPLRLSTASHEAYVDGLRMPLRGAYTIWFAHPDDVEYDRIVPFALPARTLVWDATSHLHGPGRPPV